ncbi:sulfatase/phosphatase domain-containing protein, partial [Croceicoccus estronivorus]|uniref:sulfatase/phosphatase domain-containing protein n=1 Tax=Croceicoccus estronivorus TaxID=1172626 RepID=UPI000B03DDB8
GASAEGGLDGSINYMGRIQGLPEPEAVRMAGMDRIGSADAYAQFNAGWAWALDTPFQWTKTVASHLGGTRNGMVLTWPEKIKTPGGLRSQFGHVNDIVPTILEAAGIEAPKEVNGIVQKPMNGTSLVYSFNDAKAPERHTTQYFEVFGNRAIYHDGWMASAFHNRLPWNVIATRQTPIEADTWELYDLRKDFSQSNNLAEKYPEKLAELKALFMQEAEANNVLPLRGQPVTNDLPDLAKGVTRATYHEGTVSVPEKAVPHMFNRSWSLSSDLDVQDETHGVVATIGGNAAGWSLYLDADRRPTFTYRMFELKTVDLKGAPLAPGKAKLKVDFDYDGTGYAKGGKLTLSVNGQPVASDTLPATPPAMFSINETFDVGIDTGSAAGKYPVDAPLGYSFENGKIDQVTIELR